MLTMRPLGRLNVAITLALSAIFAKPAHVAEANVLNENTVLGSSVATQDSNCGWLVMPNSTISPTASTTIDVIFTLATTANPASAQPLIGGTSGAVNILIDSGQAFKRIGLDYGLGTDTCNWKLMQHGVASISAVLTPTEKNLVTTVPGYLQVFVITRSTKR